LFTRSRYFSWQIPASHKNHFLQKEAQLFFSISTGKQDRKHARKQKNMPELVTLHPQARWFRRILDNFNAVLVETLIPDNGYPPSRQPCPHRGLNSPCDATVLPVRDTPEKNCFHKTEIEAAAKVPKRERRQAS
jgi:hypothetical protein